MSVTAANLIPEFSEEPHQSSLRNGTAGRPFPL